MDRTSRHHWIAWARRLSFGFVAAFALVEIFFVYDAMDFWGYSGFYVMGAGLLVASCIRLWIAVELFVRLGQLFSAKRNARRFLLSFLIALFAWSPSVVLRIVPKLPHYSFLWRHEDDFMRVIRTKAQRPGVTHYEHGAAFEFLWYTISDCCYVVIYEPNRPAGKQPLSRDTESFYPGRLDFDIHLWGPWYAVLY